MSSSTTIQVGLNSSILIVVNAVFTTTTRSRHLTFYHRTPVDFLKLVRNSDQWLRKTWNFFKRFVVFPQVTLKLWKNPTSGKRLWLLIALPRSSCWSFLPYSGDKASHFFICKYIYISRRIGQYFRFSSSKEYR